ncbi:GntR family transcriptional regulator [Brevibacterium sp. 50QC2O2]|jgi:DNA-binding GntR family transcriptional regulator|uniref:GntR family transcriptional regulator n=1 Tax=Brevibacterium sp. 50QC2O2 TaxID=2968459 RepID=UPI00211BCCF8|nr:GntR family transcriptional regulator [Brevibacterium sp. 50QC2O2]MCQ9388129.1 GntR family transcriptional regulator [Brevibacterium sp. 50QC2O2]
MRDELPLSGTEKNNPRLSAQVYSLLRRRIITGDLPQGTRITEQRLAAELEVSRIPLREALPKLAGEGFISSQPRRGAIVETWSTKDVHDLFDTRLALEPAAAGYAAELIGRGGPIGDLREAFAITREKLIGGDELEVAEANAHFHQIMVDTAGNVLLSNLMRATSGRMAWLFYLTRNRDPHLANAEHQELTEIIASGNRKLAEAAVYAHIEQGRIPSLEAMSDVLTNN